MAGQPSRIQLKCPCGAVLAVPPEKAGLPVACSRCGKHLRVPAAAEPRWFLARHRQKLGPFSVAQLKQLAVTGQLEPQDMLLAEGQPRWVEAGSVRGIFTNPPALPPLPPIAAPPPPRDVRFPAAASTAMLFPGPPPRHQRRRMGLPWVPLLGVGAVVLLACGGISLAMLGNLWPGGTGVKPGTEQNGPGDSADAGAGEKARPKRALDLSHIPAEASAAVIVHPRQILQSPLLAGLLPPGTADAMSTEIGIRPEQIDEVILFAQVGGLEPVAPAAPTTPTPPPPTDSWLTFDSPEGRFSIRFPAAPKQTERRTLAGNRQVFTSESENGDLLLEISYLDFKPDSPFVGAESRVNFGARALEFKTGYKETKPIKLGSHPGAEVVIDDTELKTFGLHRVYVVGDRLYQLEATRRKANAATPEFQVFFDSFRITGEVTGGAPPPSPGPVFAPEQTPWPGVIVRLSESANAAQILKTVLHATREAKYEGKTYHVGPDAEGLFGMPMAGFAPDGRTLLLAPEPLLRKMMSTATANSPLLARLREADGNDALTALWFPTPYRKLTEPLKPMGQAFVPPDLADALDLPDHLDCLTIVLNPDGARLLQLVTESSGDRSADAVEKLVHSALTKLRLMYPDLRPAVAALLPPSAVPKLIRYADALATAASVNREGTRLVLNVDRPTIPEIPADLIAGAGFNDAQGTFSDSVVASPYPLNLRAAPAGLGEPGWAGPWTPVDPAVQYQKEDVFEGDGALYLTGRDNFGPGLERIFAEPQVGRFAIEMRFMAKARPRFVAYVKNGGAPFRDGPVWQLMGENFQVLDGGSGQALDTGFPFEPKRWHKLRIDVDVPGNQWAFSVDDRKFAPTRPLAFRSKQNQLDRLSFLGHTGPGVYIDDLRILRVAE